MSTLEPINDSNKQEAIEFLLRHEEYTLFLLSNLSEHGASLIDAPNSGNFKLIRSNGKIVAVFCLTRRSTLLMQTEVVTPQLFDTVLTACQKEPIVLSGVIGEWTACSALWEYLKSKQVITKETLISKEVLYKADLKGHSFEQQQNARQLLPQEYGEWRKLRDHYVKEMGFPDPLTEAQKEEEYFSKIKAKIQWGVFENNTLVTIGDLNAKAQDLGQVGGVFTLPEFRGRGLAKVLMKQIMKDAQLIHNLRSLIIFTDEGNTKARKVYEGLSNVKFVGYYALLFGE